MHERDRQTVGGGVTRDRGIERTASAVARESGLSQNRRSKRREGEDTHGHSIVWMFEGPSRRAVWSWNQATVGRHRAHNGAMS